MHQVLFTIPVFGGIPMYGFGAMLFVCFVAVTLWGSHRARRTADMPPAKFQDMVIWLFVSGIIGARVLYMIQYSHHFPNKNIGELALAFFKIWEGGIIFYGSALGGVIGYGLFYWFVLRRLEPHVSGWRLADAVAPLLALGLAIGRIGCYLNGCCWGQVACEECRTVPLGAAHFPLLPAHARQLLVREEHLQTTTGFTLAPRQAGDPRSVVGKVEAGSPADRAGVKPGDRIAGVNGEPNYIVVDLSGPDDKVKETAEAYEKGGAQLRTLPGGKPRALFNDFDTYRRARLAAPDAPGVDLVVRDNLEALASDWPRGQSELTLAVERGTAQPETVRFAPATIGLYPTQLYETVSMVLLILLLLAYYPFRRHDGQVMVLLMVGYAVHRFINESLRIEPTIGAGLTLSQWGSVVILAAAIGIEIYLRRTMPSPPDPLPPLTSPPPTSAEMMPPL